MADAYEALKYISFLSRRLHEFDIMALATLIMIDLNFAETHDGFDYLRRAIALYLQYHDRVQMKMLYSDVGSSYPKRVRWKQVERSMRYAIEEAWENSDDMKWRRLFPVGKNGNPVKPTSSEFIARIACLIEVQKVCLEGEDNEKYFDKNVHC